MELTNTGGKDYGLSIEGHFVEPRGSAQLLVINLATGETWATISSLLGQVIRQVRYPYCHMFSTWQRSYKRERH